MMERIGDHLTYLAKYAASYQSSEEVQKVHLITYVVLLLLTIYFTGTSCGIL